MATKGLQAIGGGLGGLLGALARNKQAKASGEPGENVLQAVAAGMGADEALEQYRKDRDERQFLAGLAEQIAAQARGTEIEPAPSPDHHRRDHVSGASRIVVEHTKHSRVGQPDADLLVQLAQGRVDSGFAGIESATGQCPLGGV